MCEPRGERKETYQLSLREVFLPPKVLVHGREHRQAVVGVHKNVDETVQGRSEEACGSRGRGLAFPDSVVLIPLLM